MNIRPNSSEHSPSYIENPSSNFMDNSEDGTRYIQPSGVDSNSLETKALENRSVIETKIITYNELKNLISEQTFDNNVHYRVEGDLNLQDWTGLTALPENLSVGGHLDLRYCTGLTALSRNLSVGGDLNLKRCTDLTALSGKLSVGGHLDLRYCTGLKALSGTSPWGGTLIFAIAPA